MSLPPSRSPPPAVLPPLVELYDAHARFVARALTRLGVAAPAVDDAVQDVFVVALRRGAHFEGRSSARTWLYGIALRVARRHRARARPRSDQEHDPDRAIGNVPTPEQSMEHKRAAHRIEEILSGMDASLREVFVLAELEELTAPEIADALGIKLNTVYSRLRLSRERFDAARSRDRARERHEVGG